MPAGEIEHGLLHHHERVRNERCSQGKESKRHRDARQQDRGDIRNRAGQRNAVKIVREQGKHPELQNQ